MDVVPGPFTAAAIASIEAVAVVDITNPTELNSLAGSVVGERRVCYQVVAADNVYTTYFWDSADSGGASSPYVVAGSSGFWIAAGGRYSNSAVSLRSTLLVSGAATLSSTLTLTGATATFGVDSSANASRLVLWDAATSGSRSMVIGAATTPTAKNWEIVLGASTSATQTLSLVPGASATGQCSFSITQGDLTVGNGLVTVGTTTTVAGREKFFDGATSASLTVGGAATPATRSWEILGSSSSSSHTLTMKNAGAGSFHLTLTKGDLTVTSGQAGIGSATNSGAMLVVGTSVLSATTERGIFANFTASAAATSAIRGFQATVNTPASVMTATVLAGYHMATPTVGATSAVTSLYGFSCTDAVNSLATNVAGYFYGDTAPTAGNWAFYNSTTRASFLGGALTLNTGALTLTASTGTTLVVSSTNAASATFAGGITVSGALTAGAAGITTGVTATGGTNGGIFTTSDSGTTNRPFVSYLDHTSSGTPAAGYGLTFGFRAKSDTTNTRTQGAIDSRWVVATDASRTGRLTLYATDATTDRECVRLETSGTAAMIGLYATAAVIQYATTGTSTGFTAGAGTTVTHLSTFTGNTGSTAYTIADIVRALKLIGAIAA